MHVIYGSLAVIGILLFVCFMSFVVLCFFDSRTMSTDMTSKASGRFYLLYIWVQVVVVACYSFMQGIEYQYLQILIQFVLALLLYLKFGLVRCYFNRFI